MAQKPAPLSQGCAGRAQSAYESRGNRIRQDALEGRRHFLGRIRANMKRLSFALLYRNLMAACQIWCEHDAADVFPLVWAAAAVGREAPW